MCRMIYVEHLCGIKQAVLLDQIIHPHHCLFHLRLSVQGSPDSEGSVCPFCSTEGGTGYLVVNGDGLRSFCQNPEPASALTLPSTVKFIIKVRLRLWCLFLGGGDRAGCVCHMMDENFPQILGFTCMRDKHWW